MGWAAARKLRRAVDGLTRVLAIELLTAARGIDLRAPLQPAAGDRRGDRRPARAGVGGPGPDRFLAPEIEAAVGARPLRRRRRRRQRRVRLTGPTRLNRKEPMTALAHPRAARHRR